MDPSSGQRQGTPSGSRGSLVVRRSSRVRVEWLWKLPRCRRVRRPLHAFQSTSSVRVRRSWAIFNGPVSEVGKTHVWCLQTFDLVNANRGDRGRGRRRDVPEVCGCPGRRLASTSVESSRQPFSCYLLLYTYNGRNPLTCSKDEG